MEQTSRVKKIKENLIKELPFFPNDRYTLSELEGQSLNEVLIHYLHWKTRIVPPRRRKIEIASEVTSDQRWRTLKPDVKALFKKVSDGEDLYPFHSQRAHKKGYTPLHRISGSKVDAWEDKDQILNTKGFHHFHLNMNVQSTGLSERTNDVLFAVVTRDSFRAIGIFNHDVFEPSDPKGNMTAERQRMWEIHEKYVTLGMEPGSVYISNPISTSGHPFYLVRMADVYASIIRDLDQRLDDRPFVDSLYDQGRIERPNKFNFEWQIDHLDLSVFDKRNNVRFNIYKGHI